MPLQPRGEAGDVLDELLLGGSVELVCTVVHPRNLGRKDLELRVIYIPASGELAGRECTLAPSFVEKFLQQPRPPRPDEYQLHPPSADIIDLTPASGHQSMANNHLLDVDGRRKPADNPTTPPQKHGRPGTARARGSCGMRCGSSMGLRGALAQGADARRSAASEKQGGLTEA